MILALMAFTINVSAQLEKKNFVLGLEVGFINKASIQRTLSQIPDGAKVIIDASNSINIDHDVVEIIEEFKANAEYRDIQLELIEFESVYIRNQAKEAETAFANNLFSGEDKVVSSR